MTNATRLYVSKVVQKAFIEVNEEGSEAAATTAVGFILQCYEFPTEPQQFNCDRPFLYLIKDNQSGLILFAGKVEDPIDPTMPRLHKRGGIRLKCEVS
jgi:serpin B